MKKVIHTGLIGFGLAGRVFHAPLLKALPEFKITKVMTSQKDKLQQFLPQAHAVDDVDAILSDPNIELVINCAPNPLHFSYSMQALKAGKHVVIEKPFATTVDECTKLIQTAKQHKRVLSVFQNRRWDSDFLTLQSLIKSGQLGELVLFESHFDRYRPNVRENKWKENPGPASGILYDLGSHLIDQALVLFGWPEKIFADLESQKGVSGVVDYFHLVLQYKKLRVILHSDSFNEISPRFRVLGRDRSFVKFGLDPQEQQLNLGLDPLADNFGKESPDDYGQFITYHNGQKKFESIEPVPGNYLYYYRELYNALVTGDLPPVKPEDALNTIRLIEIAQAK